MAEEKDIVSITHEGFDASAADRETFADVCGGTRVLREKHTKYLPQFPLEHPDDYAARWQSATLLNASAKTRETMCGLVFQKPMTLSKDVPTAIAELCENIDNKGNHLNVFARSMFDDGFDGWSVILADAPTATVSDLGQQKALGLRPYAVGYKADDVRNWDYEINPVSRKKELSLIVLRERTTRKTGLFRREKVTQYRVFYLLAGKIYWQLWEEQKDKGNKVVYVQIETDTVIDRLTAIPVAVIGELGDPPPLMDLAYLNLKYAQKESDYDSIIHKTCVPIPYTTGISKEEAGKAISGGTMWHLPKEGTIAFAEVAGSSIERTRTNLEDLKVDMAWLGLQLLMPKPHGAGKATATEVVSDSIQDTSALQTMATQMKDAFELVFGFFAQYMNLGEDKGGSIELGCSWQQLILTPQEMQVLSQNVADGTLSLESYLWHLERAGKLPPDVTAEDEKQRIEKEMMELKPVQNAQLMPNEKTNQNQPPPPTGTEGSAGGAVPHAG